MNNLATAKSCLKELRAHDNELADFRLRIASNNTNITTYNESLSSILPLVR